MTSTANHSDSRNSTTAPISDADKPEKSGADRRSKLKPLRALKPYILKHRGMVIAAIIALIIAAAATLAVPMGVRRMIDYGFSPENSGFIDKYFGMMIIVGGVLAVSSAARFYLVTWLGERIVADLRSDVFSHLTSLSPAFYEKTHSGEVMSRLTADTTQIKSTIGAGASVALRNLVLFTGALTMMFVTSLKLSLLVLLAIPVIILPLFAYGRYVRTLSRKAQDTLAEASAYASENLSSVRTLQAFTHEKKVMARFDDAVERSFDAASERTGARAGLTAIAIFLIFASVVGILWYGSGEVLSGAMSQGRLGQFVLYAVFAASSLGQLSEVWGEIQQAAGSAERLNELLLARSEIKSPTNPKRFSKTDKGQIKFQDVRFSYPTRPDQKALDDVNFTITPGEVVAVVGPSGAGKSTIFNLLLRFYDPASGRVEIDGVPVHEADLNELRNRIAIVPQEINLFADTIIENIRYGSENISRAKVEAAAKAALAHDFIMEIPGGYSAKLGEHGVNLSGGQRQRIAIARAILREAPILLLDEATSALDADSEKKVQEALEHAMEGRTTLIIAHRLATVKRADRILVVADGKIIEEGTHEGLSKAAGIYSELAELQFGA